jgi:hypothetical protein
MLDYLPGNRRGVFETFFDAHRPFCGSGNEQAPGGVGCAFRAQETFSVEIQTE